MAAQAGSLAYVNAWATREFPDFFAKVVKFGPFLSMHSYDGEDREGHVVLQPIRVTALLVGRTHETGLVYAHILANDDVELFTEYEAGPPTSGLSLMEPILGGLCNVNLQAPFQYPIEAGHAAAVDRLETLIRYFYLRDRVRSAVLPKLGFFEAHFKAACRDVARGMHPEDDVYETDDDETLLGETAFSDIKDGNGGDPADTTLPGDTPPDLFTDIDIAGLGDNATAASIFNSHVHAMDESYHGFKTSMLTQLGSMQTVDRERMARLQAQNQDLECKLAVSENDRARLCGELEGEKMRSQTSLEEIAKWKAQYEGLKGVLHSALGQQM